MSVDKDKLKVVWGATERRGEIFWTRVGFGLETKDGVVYAVLSVYPLTGRICIKDVPGGTLTLAASVEEAMQ